MEKCSICKKIKKYNEFCKDIRKKNGIRSSCKKCNNLRIREWRKEHPEYHKLYQKSYRKKYKIIENLRVKKWREKQDKYKYYENRKEYIKTWKEKNKDRIKNYHKSWLSKNKKRFLLYLKNRRNTDIQFKIKTLLRSRIYLALKNNKKIGSAVKDLGCTIEELKKYLENQFQDGMTWDNHSVHGWHIDHIRPLSSFDLTNRDQFLKAIHYTNLQPLWAKENLSKGDKVI